MKILVTGGLGTIGTVLVRELEARGHHVTIADLPHHHAHNYVRCDVAEKAEVDRIMGYTFDVVYHLAAEFGRWNGEDHYQRLWRANCIGTKNVIRAQEQYGFRAVYFSSSEVYGDYDGVMSEDVPERQHIHLLNDYAISKWVNEMQVMNSAMMMDTQSVRVRLFNTYGPGEHYSPYRSALCQFIYKALMGQKITVFKGHKRTSTFVTDTVRTLANISDNFISGEVYNIGGYQYHTMEEAAQMVQAATGCDPALIQYEDAEPFTTTNKRVDLRKAERDLDHKCFVNLEDGIARTVAWMRDVYLTKELA